MVFVVLGTNDKDFSRLLRAIDHEIEKGTIKDEVVVQTGVTKYHSKHLKLLDFISMDDFNHYIEQADYIITHGGVGTIIDCLKLGKKMIAVPRLKKYKEHVNDHQLQIISEFEKDGYLIGVENLDDLGMAIKKIENFHPKKYRSNNKKFVKMIENYIEKDQHTSWYNRYREVIFYLVFGVLTTVVNILSFYIMDLFGVNTYVNNTIAWVLSVIFAYVTNKLFVFESKTNGRKELVKEVSSFFGARILSYVIDMAGMYLLVSILLTNKMFAKVVMNVVVIILNYIFSKLFVFQKKKKVS